LSVSGRAPHGVTEPQIGTPTHFTAMLCLNHTYTHTKTKLLNYLNYNIITSVNIYTKTT